MSFDPPPSPSVYGKPDAIYNGERWIFSGAEHVVDQVIRFADEQRIPSLFGEAEAAERGATLSYGVNLTRELGRAADQLAQVLKGAKAGELPVDTSTEDELVVNKKAAGALGIAIPASILTRANRVIGCVSRQSTDAKRLSDAELNRRRTGSPAGRPQHLSTDDSPASMKRSALACVLRRRELIIAFVADIVRERAPRPPL